jgi:3-phenylpropionate/trans-cinnamate dioxygenase ferredoxin subunit
MTEERVLSTADLAPGEACRVLVGGLPICLVHAEDGNFYAVDDRCSHEEAELSDGWCSGTEIECPRHNAMFDLRTGAPTSLPAVDAVATHAVAVRGDDVFVTVDVEAPAGG